MGDVVMFPGTLFRVPPPAPLCRIVPDVVATRLERERGRIEGRYCRHQARDMYGKARNLRAVSGVVMAELWDANPDHPTGKRHVLVPAEQLDLCPPWMWWPRVEQLPEPPR